MERPRSIVELVEEFVKDNPIYYKGFNIKNFLIVRHYLKLYKPQKEKGVKHLLRFLIFKTLSIFQIEMKAKYKANLNVDKKAHYKYVIVQAYTVKNKRLFSILDEKVQQIEDKNEILIITNQTCVYEYYTKESLSCILIEVPKITYHRKIEKQSLPFEYQNNIYQGAHVLNTVSQIFEEVKPAIVLTTQDYYFFDTCLAQAAIMQNIKTITHQHGILSDSENTLCRFVFSDKIFVWGEETKRTLLLYLPKDKIEVTGTNKFKDFSDKAYSSRRKVCLALNPIADEQNKQLVEEVFLQLSKISDLETKYDISVKLHPVMDEQKWLEILQTISESLSLTKSIEIIKGGDNNEILNNIKVLLTYRSTISLEAFICGASVIELKPSFHNNYSSSIFKKIPESLVETTSLKIELQKRLDDFDYFKWTVMKQKQILKEEINNLYPVSKELRVIDHLIEN